MLQRYTFFYGLLIAFLNAYFQMSANKFLLLIKSLIFQIVVIITKDYLSELVLT
jgi:hypothetical protein